MKHGGNDPNSSTPPPPRPSVPSARRGVRGGAGSGAEKAGVLRALLLRLCDGLMVAVVPVFEALLQSAARGLHSEEHQHRGAPWTWY